MSGPVALEGGDLGNEASQMPGSFTQPKRCKYKPKLSQLSGIEKKRLKLKQGQVWARKLRAKRQNELEQTRQEKKTLKLQNIDLQSRVRKLEEKISELEATQSELQAIVQKVKSDVGYRDMAHEKVQLQTQQYLLRIANSEQQIVLLEDDRQEATIMKVATAANAQQQHKDSTKEQKSLKQKHHHMQEN